MMIGKRGAATTAISAARPDRVTVRGRNLAADLMGKDELYRVFLSARHWRAPTENQRFFLDMSLIAIAEHGLTPSVQAARMTYAADPAALQGAVAAGVLGCGTVILGAADLCRKLIDEVLAKEDRGASPKDAALAIATGLSRGAQGDPRLRPSPAQAARSARRAHDRARAGTGIAGRAVAAALELTGAVAEVWGKPLPMNVSMAIAATMRDLDVPASLIRGIPILARTAGLIAHLGEEAETPIGFLLAAKGEEGIEHTADAP